MAREGDCDVIETVAQLRSQQDGLAHMAVAVRILLNDAMKVEQASAPGSLDARTVH